MHVPDQRKIRRGVVAAAGALALSVAGYAAPAGAAPASQPAQLPGSVSPRPVVGTPELVPSPGSINPDRIRQMVQCGGTMYAVGSFSKILQGGGTFPRNNVFSFSATAPYAVTSWNPNVNGIVNSIAFNGSDCSDAYIGGAFTSVHRTAAHNIAEISTSTGAVQTAFGTGADGGEVETMLGAAGHILVGGHFTSINGSTADRYMASVSPVTGQDDGFLHLNISGHYHYCNSSGTCNTGIHTHIYNQQLSHGGKYDLVEGNFTKVGGVPRQQIFMLNLTTQPASVTRWTSPEWDGSDGNLPGGYPYQCEFNDAYYIQSAAWSPDDSTVYIADNGNRPWNVPSSTKPRTGLCDAVAAFPAAHRKVFHRWIEYSGCDSYYSVAADTATVYAAGHPRWADNTDTVCERPGRGSVPDHGLQGLHASTGKAVVNGSGAAVYSMSRANADSMLITSAGLWISSTNRFGSQWCGGKPRHAGICLLPYR